MFPVPVPDERMRGETVDSWLHRNIARHDPRPTTPSVACNRCFSSPFPPPPPPAAAHLLDLLYFDVLWRVARAFCRCRDDWTRPTPRDRQTDRHTDRQTDRERSQHTLRQRNTDGDYVIHTRTSARAHEHTHARVAMC